LVRKRWQAPGRGGKKGKRGKKEGRIFFGEKSHPAAGKKKRTPETPNADNI